MGNPFSFFPKRDATQHRLTDIETEEVSLVDKGANKRKFAVIKRDLETNTMSRGPEMFEDINKEKTIVEKTETVVETAVTTTDAPVDEKASAILEGMTAGLEKLASLTEMVKSHVEKSETAKPETLAEWKAAMETVISWAADMQKAHFIAKDATDPVGPNGTSSNGPTGMAGEVAAQAPGASTGANEKPEDNKTKMDQEVATQAPGGSVLGDVASDEAKASAGLRAETEAQVLGTTKVTKTATEILSDVSTTILDLASTVPSVDDVKKALAKMDGLFVSGGLYIDAYDVEALAAVCNAICEAMMDPNEENEIAGMKKAADKILAEVSKRTVAVSKRVAKANATTSSDGKELKIVSLMLKALENGLSTLATTATNAVAVPAVDPEATQKLVDAAVAKAVEAAVAKAVAPIAKQNEELTAQVTTLKTEKGEIAKKLTAAMSETQTRGSSAETVTKNDDLKDLFPSDYNAPTFAELNKV